MKIGWPLLFLLLTASAQAQMYRWVDSSGKVNYSDRPPPTSVKTQKKALAAGEVDNSGLPYALSQATKNNPVTLYTATSCAPCDEGRALLKSRGVPFSEKTVGSNADAERMKLAGGDGRLPFVTIGRTTQVGFDASSWDAALTSAGYPESSQLPANFRYAPAQSAAPAAPAAEKPAGNGRAPNRNARTQPPAENTAPSGFRF
ncbi:MAG: glutaredoxin family protein [Burkholderiaceae bacterium]|nr:glutaredoxin family protein [Burkholderiaceae bacterium]